MTTKRDDALLRMLGEIQATNNADHASDVLAAMLQLAGLDPNLAKEAGKPQSGKRRFYPENGRD